jgi:hypothetical protein
MQPERQLRPRRRAGGEAATPTADGPGPPTHRTDDSIGRQARYFSWAGDRTRSDGDRKAQALEDDPPPGMLMAPSRAGGYPKGGLMPASTPEQIHRLFEEAFNAGDLDGLMELYEPDAALIAQPGSVAHGSAQARAALQGS